jgi:hypothetical protein
MLLLSLFLLAAAVVAFVQVPEFLIHSRYPIPVYALLVASTVAALVSRRRGVLRSVAIAGAGLVMVLLVSYTAFFSEIGAVRLALRPGDPFPDFTLQTSTGETFSPSQLHGETAALYVFYRGHW